MGGREESEVVQSSQAVYNLGLCSFHPPHFPTESYS